MSDKKSKDKKAAKVALKTPKPPKVCKQWSSHKGEKGYRECGRLATKKYNQLQAIEDQVKPKWIPVCAIHARVVSSPRHYNFRIHDL